MCLLLLAGCRRTDLLEHSFNGDRLSPPLAKPDVTWQRVDGSDFLAVKETEGRPTLLYFGYTHCPDVCPMQLKNLADAFHDLGPDTTQQLRILFVR